LKTHHLRSGLFDEIRRHHRRDWPRIPVPERRSAAGGAEWAERTSSSRPKHPPGRLGLSDFTHIGDHAITSLVCRRSRLCHFRLPSRAGNMLCLLEVRASGPGEGLQNALLSLGRPRCSIAATPFRLRFRTLTMTRGISDAPHERWRALPHEPTRNNRAAHENGRSKAR